jgi:uncharacterized protein YycO
MKLKLLILLAIFCGTLSAKQISVSELKAGDILLQPLHCWLCSLIEAQTNSPYSHIGILGADKKVYEAWGSVKATELNEFIAKTQKDEKIEVLRPVDKVDIDKMKEDFEILFEGNEYDRQFLWNNFDEQNREKLYCSELVAKLLNLQGFKIQARPMVYDVHLDHWERYFRGPAPQGELGISPADFLSIKGMKSLGLLNAN